ncbi:MAG: bifunctional hydroxymethylpyrimidine kinase/phosphomethylpyrimidine kinase [Gemmatimonadetes bacterium]|nr:MAG: bifunctional hydroxymethylpyrimidine kinase/phosphomethylpyrimidine kinase [Gemmatimonadota bacterium]
MPDRAPPPIALTIAGSDSGGGAGIQADLAAFRAFGVFGTTALTAVTAQNTLGVTAVQAVRPDVVRAQIDAVFADLPPRAVKTGMLADAAVARAVADALDAHAPPLLVVDPVMVATSGARLLEPAAEAVLAERLLPRAALVTPNLAEAEALLGEPVRDVGAMERAARALVELGAGAALVKGGHLEGARVVDVLFADGVVERLERARVPTRHTHGTGCTLSAAIAAALALGDPLRKAVERALDYTARAIAAAPGLGGGHGPLGHDVPT